MTRARQTYADRSGRHHANLTDAITADLAATLGSFAYAAKVVANRAAIMALLGEMDGRETVVPITKGKAR